MSKTCLGGLLFLFLLLVAPLRAATISVVYPKVGAPHNQIFDQIIDGIEEEFDGTVKLVSVPKKYKLKGIVNEVEEQHPDMVITLAKTGFKVAKSLNGKLPLVSGALPIRPNGISGISPIAAPEVLFSHLKQLAPKVTRINVVYNKRNQWLIDLAKITAAELGFELHAFLVKDIKLAINEYTRLTESANSEKDAFWLLPVSKRDEKVELPMLLEAAWKRRLVVFSSKPAHAKRGALFSLFPDNEALGGKLVKMVNEMYKSSTNPGVRPTTEVKLVVNIRTASHLGFEYTTKQKGQFYLTFPSQ